ncbi:MAG: 23S rRNA (pseudouridine(1915)-N(3))-methyltransferase RlmH [Candidatus Anaerobiospirillum merdipullorum]|uniref:Ribosomal RNA large subunit methyltransferase H n=1 Tax=Candidatus Anaerobiospirillum merdipullorum TaxID=2838450 RepID=A0A9E2KQ97_9GAMM|nr:23S rRNA (pseudouridine(1915)-N(3))-methyltransferase RlmH [Candidatus Anaerobiospirillum merdipullorum]
MKVHLIAIGTKMPAWVTTAFEEYQKRLPEYFALQLHELPMERRDGRASVQKLMEKEGQLILKALPKRAYVICLDEHGKEMTSVQLAKRVEFLQSQGCDAAIIIGGPDGLAPEIKALAQEMWALSKLTLPHPLVRVILAETLYRAWSISAGLPYHRA